MANANDDAFEEMVRQYARLLWSEAALGGSTELDGRERDGYFETKESIFIIEATTSKRQDKIKSDGSKTHKYIVDNRNKTFKSMAGWIVTQNEPTPDQKNEIKRHPTVRLLSFNQFRCLLFDGSSYLRARSSYPFGSARDVNTNSIDIDGNFYIPLDFEINDAIASYDQVFSRDPQRRLLITGEYGSGKSMTLRAVYHKWARDYTSGLDFRIPIYLNLRDHFGQKKPVEALEHHAREIGYEGDPSDLVRAWRSGLCHVVLDGFDELGTAGWGGSLSKVKAHRESAMTLVRNFVSETHTENQHS